MPHPPKLSDFVELAAAEYLRDTGRVDLDARWIAAYFADSGVTDAYPLQDLIAFSALVQKALDNRAQRAEKVARHHLERIARRRRRP
ncbi:hypothetical protein [Azoarcus olearius]|nr:hypothetical protein [Azoarcus olearius]